MEKLDIKRLRKEGIALARKEFKAAQGTGEKHRARLTLQRALREGK